MSGYHHGKSWQRFVKRVRPIIRAGLPRPCVDPCRDPRHPCSGMVEPFGQQWDIAHLPGRDAHLHPEATPMLEDVGPAHSHCNRSHGGRVGAERKHANTRKAAGAEDRRMPTHGSGWV